MGNVLLALVVNIQPHDLPERMMGADPDWFIEKKLAKTKQGLSFFDEAALAEYKRCGPIRKQSRDL